MSHEIRTPMNAIVGFINLLGDSDITQDQKNEIIDLAQSSSNDLLNILNDIIDISKIEADELTVNKSLNYVNRLLISIHKIYLKDISYLQKENLLLKLNLEPDSERIAIFTDSSRFKQVMSNLINNALKFTDTGEITIGYNKINQGNRKLLKFYVKDSGIGIPSEKLIVIFDRFNQLTDDRRRSFKGTGLGLAISKKLVDLLGGQIGVDSVEGQGSEFYFTLPYQILDTPDETEDFKIVEGAKIDWSKKTILIVEDTQSNYFLLENWLPAADINKALRPVETTMEMLSPIIKTVIESIANYSFYFRQKVERAPQEKTRFLGMKMRRKVSNALRNIRLLNEMDKQNPGSIFGTVDKPGIFGWKRERLDQEAKIRWINFLTGSKLYKHDLEKSKRRMTREERGEISDIKFGMRQAQIYDDEAEFDRYKGLLEKYNVDYRRQ